MPKYSDRPCARCGKMMLHAYCSQRYCKACAPLVRSDDALGLTYGCYVALHEPRKG